MTGQTLLDHAGRTAMLACAINGIDAETGELLSASGADVQALGVDGGFMATNQAGF